MFNVCYRISASCDNHHVVDVDTDKAEFKVVVFSLEVIIETRVSKQASEA